MIKYNEEVISLSNNRIQQLREDNQITVEELITYLKISRATLYNYESGTTPIPSDILILMSEKFKVSVDYILCLSDLNYSTVLQLSNDVEKFKQELANEMIILDKISKRLSNTK